MDLTEHFLDQSKFCCMQIIEYFLAHKFCNTKMSKRLLEPSNFFSMKLIEGILEHSKICCIKLTGYFLDLSCYKEMSEHYLDPSKCYSIK